MLELVINNINVNDLDNCDHLSIIKLKIERVNINLQI